MATKTTYETCQARVGPRDDRRKCGKPVAPHMRAACKDHVATLIPTGESGIYLRGGQIVAISIRQGRQVKSFHSTLEEARKAKAKRTLSQVPQTRAKFDEYAREWLKNYQGRTSNGFDENTRADYERALELHAIPFFGSTRLKDIRPVHLKALIRKLQDQGLSPGTIGMYLAPLRAMFSDAVNDGDLETNPALRLAINRMTTPRPNGPELVLTLTRDEISALLNAIPNDRDRLLVELLAQTGVRISEALGLNWSDLGQDGGTLTIQRQWYPNKLKPYTKSINGMRTIDLPPVLGRKLWALGADQTGPMFHTMTGRRLAASSVHHILVCAGQQTMLRVSPHSFRHTHTAACCWTRAGRPPMWLSGSVTTCGPS